MRIFYLESYAFGGISSHGHLYGKLTSRDEEESVELRCVLSRADAMLFNKQDRLPARAIYRPGDESTRFHSREKLNAEAVRKASELVGSKSFVLLDGHAAYMDPQPCLAAPSPLKARIDKLVDKWEAGGAWGVTSQQRKAAEATAREWDALLAEIESL